MDEELKNLIQGAKSQGASDNDIKRIIDLYIADSKKKGVTQPISPKKQLASPTQTQPTPTSSDTEETQPPVESDGLGGPPKSFPKRDSNIKSVMYGDGIEQPNVLVQSLPLGEKPKKFYRLISDQKKEVEKKITELEDRNIRLGRRPEDLSREGTYQSLIKTKQQLDEQFKPAERAIQQVKKETSTWTRPIEVLTSAFTDGKYTLANTETIKLNKDVEDKIIDSFDDAPEEIKQKWYKGSLPTEQKEKIINTAKVDVLNNTFKSLKQETSDYLKNIKDNPNISQEEKNRVRTNLVNRSNAFNAQVALDFSGNLLKNNFKSTDEDKNLDEAIFSKYEGFIPETADMLSRFVEVAMNTVGKAVTGIPTLALLGAEQFNQFTGASKSEDYTPIEATIDLINDTTNYNFLPSSKSEEGAIVDQEGNLNLSYRSITRTLADTLPFTLKIMSDVKKGRIEGSPQSMISQLLNPSKNKAFADRLNVVETAYKVTINDNYKDAKEIGMDDSKAFTYANVLSLAEGVSETIMPDFKYFDSLTGSTLKNVFKSNLKEAATKQAVKNVTKDFFKNAALELGEEEFVLAVEDGLKYSLLLNHKNSEFFNIKRQKELVAATVIMSGAMGSVAVPGKFKQNRTDIYREVYNNISDIQDTFINEINSPLNDEKAKESLITAYKFANDISNAIANAPETVTADQVDLLVQKKKLEEKKKNIDTAFHPDINEEIAGIDAKIRELSKQPVAAEEAVAEEVVAEESQYAKSPFIFNKEVDNEINPINTEEQKSHDVIIQKIVDKGVENGDSSEKIRDKVYKYLRQNDIALGVNEIFGIKEYVNGKVEGTLNTDFIDYRKSPKAEVAVTEEVVSVDEIEKRRIDTESKIKRKDLFMGVGDFSTQLGGSDTSAVPFSHKENNGIELVEYAHPKTGSVDVIVTGKSENDFVGFYRIYENGKPTNKWSSKFNNESRNKEDFKTMISGVQSLLPEGHEYTEKSSISTDGLRVWDQQLGKGYELQYDENGKVKTNSVAINGDAIVNELGIDVNKGDFENIKVVNNKDFNTVKKALLPYLEKFGLNESNIRNINGTVKIDLPVLKQSKKATATEAPTTEVISPETITEVVEPAPSLAKEYIQSIEKSKSEAPEKFWSVDRPFQKEDGTIDEVQLDKAAEEGRIIKTESGFGVVGEDGDIKGVFKADLKSTEKTGDKVIQEAVKKGGIKLDNFALPNLMKIYERNGFREVSRLPFNEEYAPEGWTPEQGTPDVVAMVYDPNGELNIEKKSFTDYDEAMSYRDSYVKQKPTVKTKLAAFKTKYIDKPVYDRTKLDTQVDNAKKSLSKLLPNVKFVVHDTRESFIGVAGKNGRGYYDPATKTIHINALEANARTVAHEVFHSVLLDKVKTDANARDLTKRMISSIAKTLEGNPDLKKTLDDFIKNYDENIQSEEKMAELFGYLADGYSGFDAPTKSVIKRAMDRLAKMFGLKPFTEGEIVDMLKTLSGKVATGEEIVSKDVEIIKPAKTDDKGNLEKPSLKSKENLESKRYQIVKDTESSIRKGNTVSTRTPNIEGIHNTNENIVDLKSLEKDQTLVIKIAKELSSYGLSKIENVENIDDANKLIQDFKNSVKDNLKFLYDSFGKEVRDVAKLWYDGANKISNEIADKYGYSTDQVAGVMASLSPQMDWFKNLSLGKRVIDIYANQQNTLFDSKMNEWVGSSATGTGKNKKPLFSDSKEIIKRVDGKKLSELDIKDKAIFIRAYDEMYNSKNYENISPNGEINGLVRKKDGTPGACGWGDFSTIQKSISILEDGSIENISKRLGEKHKVRNFFNNISNPSDPNAVTIDTHAVAAGLLLPLSGSSKEVAYNFGGSSSKSTGSSGSYPVYADAYRELAKELGILPRELQSITWEAVRGLFKVDFKLDKSNEKNVKEVWSKYKNGEISIDKAHSDINDLAGGISKPIWYEYIADDNVKSLDENSAAMDQANEDLEGRLQESEDYSDMKDIVKDMIDEGMSISEIKKIVSDELGTDQVSLAERAYNELTEEVITKEPTGATEAFRDKVKDIPESGKVSKYLSGETIERVEGEAPRNIQEIDVMPLVEAGMHGKETVAMAKEVYGDKYIEKTLEFLDTANLKAHEKALLYVSLENEMFDLVNSEPNNVGLKKLQDLVRAKSQQFLRESSLAINMGRLRAIMKDGFNYESITDGFLSTDQLIGKKEVEKAIQSDANAIQKEYEGMVSESDIEQLILSGVEKQINEIYKKLPTARKVKADKAIAALERIQKKLKGKAYDATIGLPIALIDSGITIIKNSIKAGVNIADAIELGINHIKEKYGKDWTNEGMFRDDMTQGFKSEGVSEKEIKAKELSDKDIVNQALIEAGFGKEITVKKEKRNVLDWKKLAGEEGSVDKLRENVEKIIGKEAANELEDEYNNLRASIIEKSLNELERRNISRKKVNLKTSAKKLAEIYNYGAFEKDSDTYDQVMNTVLGMNELDQKSFNETKKLAKSLAELFSQKDSEGNQLNQTYLKHAERVINKQIERLLSKVAWSKSNGAYKAVIIAKEFVGLAQRNALVSVAQAVENTMSGYISRAFKKIGFMFDNVDTKALKESRNKLARMTFKDITLGGGLEFGDVTSPFITKSKTMDLIINASDSRLYHALASTALGKPFLESADSMHKAALAQGFFHYNLIKILRKKGYSKSEAKNYVSEQLTGQSFEDALVTSKQIIDKINQNAGKKVIPDSKESIYRFANDLVNEALVQGNKITLDELEASLKSAETVAGFELGHEPNNIISKPLNLFNSWIQTRTDKAVKDEKWNDAAALGAASIVTTNILNPYVGGGTNWTLLAAQKAGIPTLSTIYWNIKARGSKLDLSTEEGMKNLEKDLKYQLLAKNANTRMFIGAAVTLAAFALANATGADDDLYEWLKKNAWAKKYMKKTNPPAVQFMLAQKDKKLGEFLGQQMNIKVDAFDEGKKLQQAMKNAASGKTQKALGGAGQLAGSRLSTPIIPWRVVRDVRDIYRGLNGLPAIKHEYKASGFASGYFQGGMVEQLGLRPEDVKDVSGGRESSGSRSESGSRESSGTRTQSGNR